MVLRRFSRRSFQEKVLRPKILIPFFAFLVFMFFVVLPNWQQAKGTFFISLFFVLGSLSYAYRRFFSIRLGFEFVSVGAFLCTLAYGVGVGLFLGNVTTLLAEFIGTKIDERIIINLLSINALVLAVPLLSGLVPAQMMLAALLANVVYNVVGVGGNLILGGSPGKTLLFVSTNVFWTVAFFFRIGPLIYHVMVP